MKSRKTIAILLTLVIVAVVLVGCRNRPASELAPAWRLLDEGRYGGERVADPFVSFSPDSKTLLFSEYSPNARQDTIYRWDIGAKRIERVTEGASPNFLEDGRSFLYLEMMTPGGIFKRDLTTGKESEVMSNVRKDQFWKQVTAISYNPADKSVTLRLSEFTPRPNCAGDRYDLSGKALGEVKREKSVEVVDYCRSCTNQRCAVVVQKEVGEPQTLELTAWDQDRGKPVVSGSIGAVAWSPDGKLLAYGYGAETDILLPSGETVTVGRFGETMNDPTDPYIGRLIWSPNGRYLAVLVVTPSTYGPRPQIYVLDMAGIAGIAGFAKH